ncbi:MAG TPA: polyphenol oxidase family protein [Candidatus Limnocylindrales bacterium]|nr:polyphenol oxidase family protein [Candidatus Limnocylindrales bacterium]
MRKAPGVATPSGAWMQRDGLIFSPALASFGLTAGFTTKAQGSMAGSHHSLEEQAANRARLARGLGFAEITRTKQVHGRDVVHVERQIEPWPAADGQWTTRPGVLLGVAAADCVPILIADPKGPLGVAHAGWEGTTLRVAQALVEAMVGGGAARERLVAAIGPSIGPCCYAIDEPRARVIASRIGEGALRRADGGVVFDLWEANRAQLEAAGVGSVEMSGICTRSSGADLWSYRARGADGVYGTQLGFLGRPA